MRKPLIYFLEEGGDWAEALHLAYSLIQKDTEAFCCTMSVHNRVINCYYFKPILNEMEKYVQRGSGEKKNI